jgi:hypothetical protein
VNLSQIADRVCYAQYGAGTRNNMWSLRARGGELKIEQGRGGVDPKKPNTEHTALHICPHRKCKAIGVGLTYGKRCMRKFWWWEAGNWRSSEVEGFDLKN